MTPDQLPDLPPRDEVAFARFDPRSATPFVNRSVSEETRRAYRTAVADMRAPLGVDAGVESTD